MSIWLCQNYSRCSWRFGNEKFHAKDCRRLWQIYSIRLFSSSTTVQPPMKKGWGKYEIIWRTGGYVVKMRSCKDEGSCTATVYVNKIGMCGTLILPSGAHASTCLNKRHPKSLSHDGLDGILEYIGHTSADITHASEADIMEDADGNVVYALEADIPPLNQAPKSRQWETLSCFIATILNYCNIKHRKCKGPGCPLS